MTLAFTLLAAAAHGACEPEAAQKLLEPRKAGQGRLSWFGLAIYDATLCVDRSFSPAAFEASAFVLELAYRRELRSADIARRSIEEMRRAGEFGDDKALRWEAALRAVLPDVRDGDRIAGVNRPGRGASFYVNGRWSGEVADAEFARLFFSIWLAPTTSEPGLRAKLLEGAGR